MVFHEEILCFQVDLSGFLVFRSKAFWVGPVGACPSVSDWLMLEDVSV